MISVNLQEWIQHPETLNRDTLYELRNLLARYPYFQSLRLLYLKNLYILHDINFGAELRKAVLYIADRRQLFMLIEGERFAVRSQKKETQLLSGVEGELSIDRTLTLIDAFLATAPEEVTSQTSLDYSMDYTSFLLEENSSEDDFTPATPKLRGQSLIDDFIEKSENDSPVYLKPFTEEYESENATQESVENTLGAEAAVDAEQENQPDESEKEQMQEQVESAQEEDEDSCFTETLAKIYVKQRRYSKALEIIKKLSLKYPKKNAYFADQIRFLEKLIINANSK